MRILIIDDDLLVLTTLERTLKSAYFAVDLATDGEAGLRQIRHNDYDLVIVDLSLPKKSGTELCQEIRTLNKPAKILVLSALTEITTKVQLLSLGADDYLTKPFSIDELVARVRALLRRPQMYQRAVLTYLDLELDINSRKVFRNHKEIRLTPKEFMLLEYLLRYQGEVISRTVLLEHVWDIHADPFTNTVETHITTLRKKIDSGSSRKLIHTMPGFGYKLDRKR